MEKLTSTLTKALAFSEKELQKVLKALKWDRIPPMPTDMEILVDMYRDVVAEEDEWFEARGSVVAKVLAMAWREEVPAVLRLDGAGTDEWVQALIPVAQYLEPLIRRYPGKWKIQHAQNCLADHAWVTDWVGEGSIEWKQWPKAEDWKSRERNYFRWQEKGLGHLLYAIGASLRKKGVAVEPRRTKQYPVPSLPADYVERSIQQELVELLIARTEMGEPVWRGVVLYGASGIGKTTLMTSIARTEAIEQAFDQVLWVDASTDGPEQWLRKLCVALKLDRQGGQRWEDCWRGWAAEGNRRFLLIIDHAFERLALKPLLADWGRQAVVMVATQHADIPHLGLLDSLRDGEICEKRVGGFEPQEGLRFVETRLGRPLTGKEEKAVKRVGERTGWDPLTLRLVATGHDADELWQGLLEELQAGNMPLGEVRQRLMERQLKCMETLERLWLDDLIAEIRYGGCFEEHFGVLAWGVSPEEAGRRLCNLERAGVVEKVRGQLAALRVVNSGWRVVPNVYWTLRGQRSESKSEGILRMVRRIGRAMGSERKLRSLHPPVPIRFKIVVFLWLLLFGLFKGIVELVLDIAGRIGGDQSLHERWRYWTVAYAAGDHVHDHWSRTGRTPTEEFGLVYDAKLGNAVVFMIMAYVLWWVFGGRLQPYVLSGLALYSFIVLGLVVIFLSLAAMDQIIWRVWIAYLCGIDTWDMRMMVTVARWLGMKEPAGERDGYAKP